MKVLLLEDDLALGAALSEALLQAGWRAVWLRRLREARAFLSSELPNAILLDLGLPDGEGQDLLKELRAQNVRLPILILTARDALECRLSGLREGADDYLVKPFAIPEMLARLHAVVRRSNGFATAQWQNGDLCIDSEKRELTMAGAPVVISYSEFMLLLELIRKSGKVVSRECLLECLSRNNELGSDNALEVHIHNLRRKLGAERIRTIRGVGYLMPKL